jgi:hypothetical protein
MKKIILLLTLFFAVNNGYSQANSEISYAKIFKMIDVTVIFKALEKEFKEQSSRWTFDTYVTMSRDIKKYFVSTINTRNEYSIRVTGEYEYKRLTKTYIGTFEAKMQADLDDKTDLQFDLLTPKAAK